MRALVKLNLKIAEEEAFGYSGRSLAVATMPSSCALLVC